MESRPLLQEISDLGHSVGCVIYVRVLMAEPGYMVLASVALGGCLRKQLFVNRDCLSRGEGNTGNKRGARIVAVGL